MTNPLNRPNLSDVALEAGYSTATVSWALRGHPRVPESTRAKILAVAERLGYRPDPRLTELMSHLRDRRGNPSPTPLALIVSDLAEVHQIRSETKAGIYARADELGYAVKEFPLDESTGGYSLKQINRILFTRNTRGVMVYPFNRPDAFLDGIDWSRFANASLSLTLRSPALHRVVGHHFQYVTLAMSRLHTLGYRRIGLVMLKSTDLRVDHLFHAGYFVNSLLPDQIMLPTLISPSLKKDVFIRWFRHARPDAILLCAHTATPLVEWLKLEGVEIPQDIGLANLHFHPDHPEVAGVDQQFTEAGRVLVDLAVGQILRNEFGIPRHRQTVLIEGTWRSGTSTRDVNA